MKTFQFFSFFAILMAFSNISFAQLKTETIPVSGNCGTCKTNIEKAAKKAGATKADWDMETKVLTVSYNSSATDDAKIQQAIAAVGYDTRDVKASDASYDKLHTCCKYERSGSSQKMSCCDNAKCEKIDGKCTGTGDCKDMGCCKNVTCTKKS